MTKGPAQSTGTVHFFLRPGGEGRIINDVLPRLPAGMPDFAQGMPGFAQGFGGGPSQ